MDILIADDLKESRVILKSSLQILGYNAILAQDGEEAFSFLENSSVSMLITDWMMPKMTGAELCRKIRAANFDRYIYVIILTARTGKDVLIEALQAGADDFLEKPFNIDELRVRIKTGVRVLDLEKRLAVKNRRLAEANRQLEETYAHIKKDLEMAAILQNDLIPKSRENIGGYSFDWLFIPLAEVAGDIFNFFRVDDTHIVFYQLDVAGHGVASAMLSFTLSKFLNPATMPKKFFLVPDGNGEGYLHHPSAVLQHLNEIFFKENDGMQFFTICYGVIHLHDDKVTISRAGHPRPVITKPSGSRTVISPRGIPVGIFRDIRYEDEECFLQKGDRIILHSDGIIEMPNPEGELYGVERFTEFLIKHSTLPAQELFSGLRAALEAWSGGEKFRDDISILLIEKK